MTTSTPRNHKTSSRSWGQIYNSCDKANTNRYSDSKILVKDEIDVYNK